MAVPKKKMTRSRRDRRRAHWKLTLPGLSQCPRCHEPKLNHRVCPSCGYYKNRQVMNKEE
ncbi:MAG: 50S ribosomal protein L32 [bacterium]|jgi:large subunit ribosomal protein L32